MIFRGRKVILKPMLWKDQKQYFASVTQTDITPWLYGKLYGDKVPTWKEFKKGHVGFIYSGKERKSGRIYKIVVGKKIIGDIMYNKIDEKNKRSSTDIALWGEKYAGKGYGTDAMRTLCKYLFKKFGLEQIIITVHKKNRRALKAYEKSGFRRVRMTKKWKRDSYLKYYTEGHSLDNSYLLVMTK